MPHIVIDKIKNISFPIETDNNKFLFKAQNLIAVESKKNKFFIKVEKREKGYLVKYDKITRPLKSEIKKAYLDFVKINEANIIFENINGLKDEIPNENLLDIFSDLSDIDIVEVGFGSGRHLIHLAKKYPDKTILGIEIHNPSIEQVLRRIKHENIKNIKVINHDARLILSKIPSNNLHSIYVHFPVPWDKKPHRRVINKEFIDESIRALKKDGFLHLRTDSENYFQYSLNQFLNFPKIDIEVKKNIEYEVSSKYEDRWKKMNKNIYDIFMKNFTISDDIKTDFDFSFEKRLINLTTTPQIFDNIVIHIEKIYQIENSQDELIRLTIGNVNRPEHLYIINKEKPEYFNLPAPIKENFKAHTILKRIFSGDIS